MNELFQDHENIYNLPEDKKFTEWNVEKTIKKGFNEYKAVGIDNITQTLLRQTINNQKFSQTLTDILNSQ